MRGGLLTGLVARALSPNPNPFWFLVGGPMVVEAARDGWPAVAAFLIGYHATIVGSNVGLALAISRWIGRASQRVYRAVLVVSSVTLTGYGLVLIGRSR